MRVALTFDTEPTPHGHDARNAQLILDALAERSVRATFFVQGQWADENPQLAARLSAEGHRVGNHTYSHALPGRISEEDLAYEIARAEETLINATGQDPKPYFRCPQNSGAFDQEVIGRIQSAQYRQTGWSFDSLDWEDECDPQRLTYTVLDGVHAHGDGAIVLLHSWPDSTAQALPAILDQLIAQGVEFVTLDELDAEKIPEATIAAKSAARGHHLGASTAWGLAAKFVTVAANFAVGVIVARALGPVGKGAYALVQQIVGVLVVTLGLGLSTSNVYFVARREVSARSATANSLWLSLVTGSLATVGCLLFVAGPFAPTPPYSVAMAVVASALFVATTLFAWLGAVAVGLSGLRPQSIAGMCSVLTVLVGAIVLAQLGMLSALYVVALGVAGQLAATAVVLWFERERMLGALTPSLSALRLMLKYSAKSYFVSLVGYLHLRQDMLLLGWLTDPRSVGIYSVAVSVAEIARYVPVVLGSALFARASQVGRDEGSALSAGVSRLTVLLVAVSVTVFAGIGSVLINRVFGEAFSEAGLLLVLLLPGVAAVSISEVPSSYLFSREVIYWRTSATMVVLNAAMNIFAIPRWGVVGAAVTSSVTYGIYAAVIIFLMKRESGLRYSDLLVPRNSDIRSAFRVLSRYLRRATLPIIK